jgi:hypothetical protein
MATLRPAERELPRRRNQNEARGCAPQCADIGAAASTALGTARSPAAAVVSR